MGRWKVQAQPGWSVGLLDGAWLATSLSPPSRTRSVPDSLRSTGPERAAQGGRAEPGPLAPRPPLALLTAQLDDTGGPGPRPPNAHLPRCVPCGVGGGPTGGKGHILVTGCLPPWLLPCPPDPQLSPRLVWGQVQALLTRPKDPPAPLPWCRPLGPARAPVSPGPEHSHLEVLPGRVGSKEAAHTA